jgi:hypothetical protein
MVLAVCVLPKMVFAADPILGKWINTYMEGPNGEKITAAEMGTKETDLWTIEFKADGEALVKDIIEGIEATYTVKGNVITAVYDKTFTHIFTLVGDTLVRDFDGIKLVYVRAK